MRNWFWVIRRQHLLVFGLFAIALLFCSCLLNNTLKLQAAASSSIDAFFVLGGSISREIYVAQLVKQHPGTKVLISQGSQDPCILLIFQREGATLEQVWLEHCADSTFGNFYFNIPILRHWGVRKVKLITSPTHLPRAKWMAQILLGAQGIWVEVDTVEEEGVPGNQESLVKTGLDITRSLIWAVLSQGIKPQCSQFKPLAAVNLEAWHKSDFKCEYQGQLD